LCPKQARHELRERAETESPHKYSQLQSGLTGTRCLPKNSTNTGTLKKKHLDWRPLAAGFRPILANQTATETEQGTFAK
jgi:hypothetical protein